MNLFTANPENLPDLWPHALPHLERFSRETQLVTPEDVYRDISRNEKQLWLVEQGAEVTAAIVTQVYSTLAGKTCCVWGAAGNSGIEALRKALTDIEKWARDIGCGTLEIRGRKGWKRALPEYKETGVLLEKQLRLH